MRESIPFIKTVRSGVVETIHRVSIVAVQNAKVIYSHGNPELLVPMRSTAKPFMLTPLLNLAEENGVDLLDTQVCIMASSHNGEKVHRDSVQSILNLSGSSPSDLRCGSHLPFYDWLYDDFFKCSELAIRQLFHNCSGKHAGMLLLCKLLRTSTEGYWLSDHPIQELITDSVKKHLNISKGDYFSVGIDGCGVPTYSISIRKLAEAYQNLPASSMLKRVYNAMLAEPYMIAGKERIDTIITGEMGFIAKSGSDGLFCISCPQQGIGIALKIEGGNDEAAECAIVEVLDQLDLLPEKEREKLDFYRFMQIHTSSGRVAGYYSPIAWHADQT